jgi:hypothetical protein
MMKLIYKQAVFYAMSGTGNTYRVSCWIEEFFHRHRIKSKVVMIEDADFNNDLSPGADLLVGLLFPTHGFMPPWSMIKFLFRMPKRPGTPAMCIATRGALKIGPLHIPGVSGFATFFAAINGFWTFGVVDIFNFLFFAIYFLFAVFLSYWIFWYLIRFPVFNTLFSLKTLTHYYRRYHQPQTRLQDLAAIKKRKSNPGRKTAGNIDAIPRPEEEYHN